MSSIITDFSFQKMLNQWKSMTEAGWKKRFESACDKKAKDVLKELASEYEVKYKQMEIELLNANEEIARLRAERDEKDEHLRKAFMRGVCALNMEAMSVLLPNPNEVEQAPLNNKLEKSSEQGWTSKNNSTRKHFLFFKKIRIPTNERF